MLLYGGSPRDRSSQSSGLFRCLSRVRSGETPSSRSEWEFLEGTFYGQVSLRNTQLTRSSAETPRSTSKISQGGGGGVVQAQT